MKRKCFIPELKTNIILIAATIIIVIEKRLKQFQAKKQKHIIENVSIPLSVLCVQCSMHSSHFSTIDCKRCGVV